MDPRPGWTPKTSCGWGKYRSEEWNELDHWDRMTVAVDCVLLTVRRKQLHVLVQRRENDPDAGEWALPGVFLTFPEREEDVVRRALKTKAGLAFQGYVERLDWSFEPGRDERGWVGTCCYLALGLDEHIRRLLPKDDRVALSPVEPLSRPAWDQPIKVRIGKPARPRLAFDHNVLVGLAISRLRSKLWHTSIGLELMPEEFALPQLRAVFEAVLGEPLNRVTFRRRVLEVAELVEPTGESELTAGDVGRPAALYRRR